MENRVGNRGAGEKINYPSQLNILALIGTTFEMRFWEFHRLFKETVSRFDFQSLP